MGYFDGIKAKMIEESQAKLPPEDRSFDPETQEPCEVEDKGYTCSKAQDHSGDHIAHGYGGICHRWPKVDTSKVT